MEQKQEIRVMQDKERAFLTNILNNSPSNYKKWKEGIQNFFVIWAASLLLVVVLWLLLAWLLDATFDFDIGKDSIYAIWVFGTVIILSGIYASISTIRWIKKWKDNSVVIQKDLDEGNVIEEWHIIKDVKRFIEPEHGGLIYFLRMTDNRILVLYDYESVELSMQDKDPLSSPFKPRQQIHVVKAPNSVFFIHQEFTGQLLDINPPIELTADPQDWPEEESWCDIPWDSLESKLAS